MRPNHTTARYCLTAVSGACAETIYNTDNPQATVLAAHDRTVKTPNIHVEWNQNGKHENNPSNRQHSTTVMEWEKAVE